MARLEVSNRQARWLWLASQGLARAPTGPLDLGRLMWDLGLLQLDTIQVVARAHDHILWSRNQSYRPPMLDRLYQQRLAFEHFTHDASLLPMAILPYWRLQFARKAQALEASSWWGGGPAAALRSAILEKIQREGALCSADFESTEARSKEMWARSSEKKALDYMWFEGTLATCHRRGFRKYYDLGARVFPQDLWAEAHAEADQVSWLCQNALSRMGFGTLPEIRKFWDAAMVQEVKDWADSADVVPLCVTAADGTSYEAVGSADIEDRLAGLAPPTSRLRLLNPFDPVVRDRVRLERLYGFVYRNEMFVPRAKRIWGYYVFPILEADRFVGRLEAKAHRSDGRLEVLGFWPEPTLRWGAARRAKLDAELDRLGRFVECREVTWSCKRPS